MKAKHRYTADDDDELSFDADEVISVIPFDNADDQARNWYTMIRDIDQGDRLYGKPGNVKEFDSCQWNVRDFSKSQESVREKILSGKALILILVFSNIIIVISIKKVNKINSSYYNELILIYV